MIGTMFRLELLRALRIRFLLIQQFLIAFLLPPVFAAGAITDEKNNGQGMSWKSVPDIAHDG